ncbi:centrosomal protein of 295 kDa isoform X2 [Lathamus discolor]|uniref:centrosomal protein of 295 kDa isoform X2 n=1 Tax=Lathamus discolor TaxID=678569 RepID=UPI0032B706F7
MKRKVAKVGQLRLSPNEETMLLKEEYERRRKLRLQQIRQKVKQRREEQLHQLEEALRAEWQKAQDEKMKALEEFYLSSLRAIGEGHRQAKENEPDLEALAKQAEERRQRAEKRHREALKEQKYQKENLLREQARRTNARKHALEVERQRAAKIASLPPPPPHPLENFEVKKAPAVKPCSADNFSVTRYHISEPYVDREVDEEQPDARSAAEEEEKRLEELHRETERERREQLEKAHVRGSHALKKVHLAQDRERLLKELEQMQNMDRMRRRQIVAQMPPQLFVPPYKRMEIKEERQRELEFAFEDMCSEDRKMKEDLILQFEPQPLPAPSDRAQDNDLDISLEQESACDTQPESACDTQPEEKVLSESEDREEAKTRQLQSKLALKRLLNKIRSQKEEWTSKSEKDTQSEVETIESGTIASEEKPLCDSELNYEQQKNVVCEARDSVKMLDKTVAAENSVLIHPQEQAAKIRMQERRKWNEQIEKQKREQLALLQQIEEERARLEADLLKIQIQTCLEKAKKKTEEEEQGQLVQSHSVPSPEQQNKVEHEAGNSTVSEPRSPGEDSRLEMIRNYQQRLLQQNRLHRKTIEEGRKHLQEYQNKLKQRHLSAAAPPSSVDTKSIHLKPVPEALLQRQGVQPTQCQSPEQVHAQQRAQLLPVFSAPLCMSENSSSQQHEEQMHNICPGRHVQFSEALRLKHGEFHLPCGHPSQEGVGMFETSSCHVREPPQFQSPSGLVMKDVTAVRTQPEAQVQHVRFMLPAEDSSEPSEVVHSTELSHHQAETKAREESHVVQAAPVDSWAYQQGYAESTIRTSLEQPLNLSEAVTLSHEKSKARGVGEFLVSKPGVASLLNYCGILNLRDRVLASSESIQAQQKYLKELQEQLDAQREALLSRQKMQEQLLLQKQDKLKEQMQRQQEALKELLNKQVRHSHASEEMTEAQKPDWIDRTDFFQVSESYQQEKCDRSKFHGSQMISQYMGPAEQAEQSEKVLFKEQKWRSSKPPVAKVKLGLVLEPHELSVIPEVDTPKSCSISFADKTDSVGGESSPISATGAFSYVKHYSHKEDRRLPSSITNSEEQTSSGSPRPSRLLQEVLLTTAESSHSSDQSQDSQVAQDSPVLAAEVGEGATAHSGLSFRLDNMEALSKVGSTNLGSEALMQEIPCDLSSTISTGSFLTSEVLDVNPVDPGLSSDSTEDGVSRETARHPWKPSLPFTLRHRQENLSGASETQLPEGEMYLCRENQILEKSTGDMSSYLEDNTRFQALTAELDFPEMERPLPNFHHQFFQPLEPSLDFDTSSSCSQHRISQDSREFSKTSNFSTQSKDTSMSLEVGNSNLTIQRSSLLSSLETNRPNNGAPEEQFVEENLTPGSEESFHPLPLESTLSSHCQNTNQLGDLSAVLQKCSDQTPGMREQDNEKCISSAREYKELARNMESIDLQCSVEDLQNESLNPLEEQEFSQLDITPGTVDDTSPQHLLKESMSSEKSPVEILDKKFVKLPERSVHLHEANKAVELDSQCNRNTKEPDQSFPHEQISLRIPRETNLEDSDLHLQAVVQQSGSLLERHEKHSRSVPRSSCSIPVWETESGCGIMEEPELTLISSNDISIAESDIEHSNQGETKEDKISSPAAVDQSEFHVFTEEREFLPLVPDADYSVFARPDNSSKAQSPNDCHLPARQTAVMVLEFVAAPGSLQESFLKRKQNFIQKSLKRVEGIKTKERANEKPEARRSHRGKSEKLSRQKESSPISGKKGAVASQLKKVGEVPSPGDRNSGETGMHQRTSRLYNQLAEVKMRKEEKTRQETYAKNREKAKEFQKKMLEKLRAKKTGKAP